MLTVSITIAKANEAIAAQKTISRPSTDFFWGAPSVALLLKRIIRIIAIIFKTYSLVLCS